MYKPDPGGNFESDAHRRVCGLIPVPEDDSQTLTHIWARCLFDDHNQVPDEVALAEIIQDLLLAGLVEKVEGGIRQTSKGYDLLCASVEGE